MWERLAALAARPSFWRTAAVSLGRIFGGFALGAAAGTLLAVITSALSWADWLFRPMVKVIRAVPVASLHRAGAPVGLHGAGARHRLGADGAAGAVGQCL